MEWHGNHSGSGVSGLAALGGKLAESPGLIGMHTISPGINGPSRYKEQTGYRRWPGRKRERLKRINGWETCLEKGPL